MLILLNVADFALIGILLFPASLLIVIATLLTAS